METYLVGPAYPSPILARVTEPDGTPGQLGHEAALGYAYWQLGYGEQWREQRLDDDAALMYSALWACVTYISQTISSLGWHVYERQADQRVRLEIEDNIAWTLGIQANPETDAFNWRQKMLKDALLGGNGYAEIERTGGGKPFWMWQLDRRRVQPDRTASGQLIYEVANGSGVKNSILMPSDMFHLRGMGDDGIVGYSVVEMARRTIHLGLRQEEFGDSFFKKGPMPGGVLKIPGQMTDEARERLRKDVQRLYGGTRNAGNVLVLTGEQQWTAATFNNQDAQWLEGRTFQADEIARWFRVPPHKIGLLARSTFSNIENQAIEAVQDCLLPWCRRLESEADVKLFGRAYQGKRHTLLNLGTLLRGDSLTQTNVIVSQVNNGLRTINEGRAYLDLNPIDGGDTALVQGAMVPLERVLTEPADAAAPADAGQGGDAPPQEDSPGGGAAPGDLARVFIPLLEAELARWLRLEEDKAKRAANKGKLAAHLDSYYGEEFEAAVARTLLPLFQALALALGRPAEDAGRWASLAAGLHSGQSRVDLRARGAAALTDWSARARDHAEIRIQEILHGRFSNGQG